jgi:hypothetical protein
MRNVPFHALFAEDNLNPNESWTEHPRDLVSAAEIVLAVDVMTGTQALIYGRGVLEGIVAGSIIKGVEVLGVELDMETDELERLVALVRVAKGHDDYQAAH